MHPALAQFLADAVHAFERAQAFGYVVHHRLKAAGFEAGMAEAFGQRDHADRQGDGADELRAAAFGRGEADPGQLGRAAANVEQQRAAGLAAVRRTPRPMRIHAHFDDDTSLLATRASSNDAGVTKTVSVDVAP